MVVKIVNDDDLGIVRSPGSEDSCLLQEKEGKGKNSKGGAEGKKELPEQQQQKGKDKMSSDEEDYGSEQEVMSDMEMDDDSLGELG